MTWWPPGSVSPTPASAAVTSGAYKDIARIDKPDSHTAKITFSRPAPFPFEPFCGPNGQVMAKHVIEPFKGAKSRELPANLKPVGTGPYRIVDFKPGDSDPGRTQPELPRPEPAVLRHARAEGLAATPPPRRGRSSQTGEYDYAWNMQVEDDILLRLEQGGRGKVEIVYGGNIEYIGVELLGSGHRGGRGVVQPEVQAPVPQRSGRAPGSEPPRRPVRRRRSRSTGARVGPARTS